MSYIPRHELHVSNRLKSHYSLKILTLGLVGLRHAWRDVAIPDSSNNLSFESDLFRESVEPVHNTSVNLFKNQTDLDLFYTEIMLRFFVNINLFFSLFLTQSYEFIWPPQNRKDQYILHVFFWVPQGKNSYRFGTKWWVNNDRSFFFFRHTLKNKGYLLPLIVPWKT